MAGATSGGGGRGSAGGEVVKPPEGPRGMPRRLDATLCCPGRGAPSEGAGESDGS